MFLFAEVKRSNGIYFMFAFRDDKANQLVKTFSICIAYVQIYIIFSYVLKVIFNKSFIQIYQVYMGIYRA